MKTKKILILALAVSAASVSSAFGTKIALTDNSFRNGSGGEFTATVSSSPDDLDLYIGTYSPLTGNKTTNTFQTFCIEHGEYFYWGQKYDATVSDAAQQGGMGPGGEDVISAGTAWLYSEFAKGTLTTTAYGSYFSGSTPRQTQAGLLQKAIWWLEGELVDQQAPNNPFIMAAEAAFGLSPGSTVPNVAPLAAGTGLAADAINGHNAAWFGVYALNLGPFENNANVFSQDQLIYKSTGNRLPDGGATLLLLGMTLSGMGALQRRMSRTA